MKSTLLVLTVYLAASTTCFADCSWLPESRLNEIFPDKAPWSTMDVRQGRCKFLTNQSSAPIGTLAINQIVESSAKEAEEYVRSLGEGMAEGGSYRVKPEPTLGKAGIAVRPGKVSDNSNLILAGHEKNIVVMTTIMFPGGIDAATEGKVRELTKKVFTADTGGGLELPKVKPLSPEEAKREKREEAEAQRAQRAEEDKVTARLAAFEDAGGGVLHDKQTGLSWTQSDNGKDVEQGQAIKYCEHLDLQGGKWRLPNVDELAALFVWSDREGTPCGNRDQRCFSSNLFHLTSYWFWSATTESATKAWHVDLSDGSDSGVRHDDFPPNFSRYHRALCVRSP
jgi:Protein of unknown function (DUF1566)